MLVTAFVPGVSLLELRNVGPLPAAVVCQIGRELGEAIDALHHATDNNGAPLGVTGSDAGDAGPTKIYCALHKNCLIAPSEGPISRFVLHCSNTLR